MAHQQPLWSGRFKEPLSEIALRFSSSVDLDKHLYQEDIAGSIAHVEMLAAVKILSQEEARRIRTALRSIAKEIDTGKLELSWEKEDVHMAIEQRLIQKVGPMGGNFTQGGAGTIRSRSTNGSISAAPSGRCRSSFSSFNVSSCSKPRSISIRSCPGTRTFSGLSPSICRIIFLPMRRCSNVILSGFRTATSG